MGRILFAVSLSLSLISKGQAVNTTVHDPWNYVVHSETLTKSVALLEQATSLNQRIDQLNKLMGVNVLGNFNDIASLIQSFETPMQGFGIGFLDITNTNRTFSQNSKPTFLESKDFWKSCLIPQENQKMTPQGQDQYLKQRAYVLKEASVNSLALATQQKQSVMEQHKKLQSLSHKASHTTNLLEAQQLNNQLMLLLIGEVTSLRALFAQQLELQGAREVQKSSLVFGR